MQSVPVLLAAWASYVQNFADHACTLCYNLGLAVAAFQKYGEEYTVVSLDKEAKVATLANGLKIQYEALVSTMPLDLTLHWLGQPKWADELSHR